MTSRMVATARRYGFEQEPCPNCGQAFVVYVAAWHRCLNCWWAEQAVGSEA